MILKNDVFSCSTNCFFSSDFFVSFFVTNVNPRKVIIVIIIISICRLKRSETFVTIISLLSNKASIPRNTNNPAVRLKNYIYFDLIS
jgi:hypothetical protein